MSKNTNFFRQTNEIRDLAVELIKKANAILDEARLAEDFSEKLRLVKTALKKSREADGLMHEAKSFDRLENRSPKKI
jgi:hypothetical protein